MPLAVAALALQVWVRDSLQDRWSAAAPSAEGHVLIREWPYRWVRHPMHAALILYFVELASVSAYSPFGLIAVLMIPLLDRAARNEETLMASQFPDEYRE